MKTAEGTLACGKCGSAVLRRNVYGLPLSVEPGHDDVRIRGCVLHPQAWDLECLSCGQRRYLLRDAHTKWHTSPAADGSDIAQAIQTYVAQARKTMNTPQASAVSYAGLWLLLASLAPAAAGSDRLTEILGLSPDDARDRARRLLDSAHPTVAAALGGWLAEGIQLSAPLPVDLERLPGQTALDQWARDTTRGVIQSFPVEMTPDTMLLLASAVVLTPRWLHPLYRDDDDMLVLDDGLQVIASTEAAGLVAVAKPFSEDGVDVLSVIAAPHVAPGDVWRAVDEVVDQLESGQMWNNTYPGEDLADGHAWRVIEVVESFMESQAPDEAAQLWRSHLPQWSANSNLDLLCAPGVPEVVQPIAALLPEDSVIKCVQAARAEYDEDGFTAAALTAMDFMATGAPQFVDRRVRRVEITFDRPHAVVAIARGGEWEGLPLFHAWVTPGGIKAIAAAPDSGGSEA